MKRCLILFLILPLFFSCNDHDEEISYKDRLYYTCKIWGYVKYYHWDVSQCSVNWDSVLIDVLPRIKHVKSVNGFNKEIMAMLDAAGSIGKVYSKPNDSIFYDKRNLNTGWFADDALDSNVQQRLLNIKESFLPHKICWVETGNGKKGWLSFPKDDPVLDIDITVDYPDEKHRLLLLFEYWNVINYFNPYNDILDVSWDSTLKDYAAAFSNANNADSLYVLLRKVAARLNDAHSVIINKGQFLIEEEKLWSPRLLLKYVDGAYVVSFSEENGINSGDVLQSINGDMCQQCEDKWALLISAGNKSVLRRDVQRVLLLGEKGTSLNATFKDSNNKVYKKTLLRKTRMSDSLFIKHLLPVDKTKWKMLDEDIAYVNMRYLEKGDVALMYSEVKDKPAIIFDVRNYPKGTIFLLADLLFSQRHLVAKFAEPNLMYPGTYTITETKMGKKNRDGYKGKVIILMDERTQSHAEYTCMILEAMPDVIKVGSQTAGADGNVTSLQLTKNMKAYFTTLGVYYPNGDSTQRIGIVPDIDVRLTRKGMLEGRDEVLEQAIEVAKEDN